MLVDAGTVIHAEQFSEARDAGAQFAVSPGCTERLAAADLPARTAALRLVNEHEMGELFKVLALHKGAFWDAPGFRAGDRTHTL